MQEFLNLLILIAVAGLYLIYQGLKGYRRQTRFWKNSGRSWKKPYIGSKWPTKKAAKKNWDDGRIHQTSDGLMVRSKSEVIVYEALASHGLTIQYEGKLSGKSGRRNDCRYPDFIIHAHGKVWYWEHLGMLDNASYRDAWNKKQQWYRDNGYAQQLLVSQDYPGGVVKVAEVHKLVKERILAEGGFVSLARTPRQIPTEASGNVTIFPGKDINPAS